MKYLALLLCLFCSCSLFAQVGVGNPIVTNGVGQPLAGASVAVCATYPGATLNSPCREAGNSLLATYTDITFATACTLNPTTLGPLNGSGCTNPGLTDALGNLLAYGASSSCNTTYGCWYEVYGNQITASAFPLGFAFNTRAGGVIPVFGGYTFSVSGGVVSALNNLTGHTDYTGTDTAVVVNEVLAALASVGGRLFFKNGIYPINSLTQETMSGYTNYYYGVGIPSNPVGSWVQWQFEGESRPAIAFNFDSGTSTPSLNSQGVIFNVTSTALGTISGSNVAVAIWQRPDSTYFFTNEDYFHNLDVRFPANTRAHQYGITLWAADSVDLEDVLVDFNQNYITLQNGSLPASDTIGILTSFAGAGNLQHLKDVAVVGYQLCYDIEGEHMVADTITSAVCTDAGEIGRTTASINPSTIFHPLEFHKVTDQENQNGWIYGPELAANTLIDWSGLDIEYVTAGSFARVNNMYEVNAGNSYGIVTYLSDQAGSGNVSINLWTAGGNRYLVIGTETTVSSNVCTEVAKVDLLNQTASIGFATLYTVPTGFGGLYRYSAVAVVTTAATSSSTLPAVELGWTDKDTSVSVNNSATPTTATQTGNTVGTTQASGQTIVNATSVSLTYATAGYVSSGATAMKYAVHLRLEYCGQ